MPTLALTDFNIVLSVLGGWVSLFGLVSYLCKETFYLSEALISLLAGVAFSPSAANFIRPLEYAGSQANLDAATLYFSRLVLGIQLVLAGVQLPSRYLKQHWKPLAFLLGPIMTLMWLSMSLLIWGLVSPRLPFLHALAIGSCVAPTDPILSNVIVKGRFADQNIPTELQHIIIAESGANDGLGYPFLFLALYLVQYIGYASTPEFPVPSGGAGTAIGLWFGETLGYTILLSVVYGAVVGYLAKELLHWAEERKFVDRESFLVFAISLALFIVGTCGLIGSDDVLACFIAGNVFTWDDWFRLETKDDSLQPTIDMLLNVAIFMWYGAVCPWSMFLHGPVPLYRLVPLGILMLVLRRLPWVVAGYRFVPQIEDWRHGIFMGFFGPIGVSAIFYLYITLDFIDHLSPPSTHALRPDVAHLGETVTSVVWFLAICSIVVHGLSVPLGKLGFYLPRTLSRAIPSSPSSESTPGHLYGGGGGHRQASWHGAALPSFRVGNRVANPLALHRSGKEPAGPIAHTGHSSGVFVGESIELVDDVKSATSSVPALFPPGSSSAGIAARPMYRIGGSLIPSSSADNSRLEEDELPSHAHAAADRQPEVLQQVQKQQAPQHQREQPDSSPLPPPPLLPSRTIRFPVSLQVVPKE